MEKAARSSPRECGSRRHQRRGCTRTVQPPGASVRIQPAASSRRQDRVSPTSHRGRWLARVEHKLAALDSQASKRPKPRLLIAAAKLRSEGKRSLVDDGRHIALIGCESPTACTFGGRCGEFGFISILAAGCFPQPLKSRMPEAPTFRYELTRTKSGRNLDDSAAQADNCRKIGGRFSGGSGR